MSGGRGVGIGGGGGGLLGPACHTGIFFCSFCGRGSGGDGPLGPSCQTSVFFFNLVLWVIYVFLIYL